MRSHADATVTIQTSAESVLSPPSWFGEVVLLARYLPRDAQRGGLIKQRSGKVGDDPTFISFCSGMLSLISLSGSQHVCQPGRSPDRMRELVPRA